MIAAIATDRLAALLTEQGARAAGPGRWTLATGDFEIAARREAGWLVLEQVAGQSDLDEIWRALRRTARAQGRFGYALGLTSGRLVVRAELPLEERSSQGLAREIADRLRGWPRDPGAIGDESELEVDEASAADLAELERLASACREAGWISEHHATHLVVRSRSPGGRPLEASARATAKGATIRCDLTRPVPVSPASQAAIAVFWAATGHSLRGVVTALSGEPAAERASVLAALPRDGGAFAVESALSACALVQELCTAELDALRDEAVARQYLAVTGWHSSLPNFITSRRDP